MANFKRRMPRARTCRGYSNRAGRARFEQHHSAWMCSWPAWHDILCHRRPHRRETARLLHAALMGSDLDEIAWPHSKKPHRYYW
jgi:hypothetical protein